MKHEGENALSVSGLTKYYDAFAAVDGIDFELKKPQKYSRRKGTQTSAVEP